MSSTNFRSILIFASCVCQLCSSYVPAFALSCLFMCGSNFQGCLLYVTPLALCLCILRAHFSRSVFDSGTVGGDLQLLGWVWSQKGDRAQQRNYCR